MRVLFFVMAALAALYSALWFAGERLVETRLPRALADLEAQGWQVAYAGLNTTGFPSRLDTTLTEPSLVSPDGRVAWSAPEVRAYALVYRPTHVILGFPREQSLRIDGTDVTIRSQGLQASARAGLSRLLPFREAVIEGAPVTVEAAGVTASLDRVLVAARDGAGEGNAYDLYLDATGLAATGEGVNASLARLDLVRLDAEVTLDRPLDRRLQDGPPPALTGLTIRDARLGRGDIALSVTGSLAPDAEGVLEGALTVAVENWRGLLDLGERAGALDPGRRALFESALAGVADGDRLEVPVTFADGQVSALGLPLLDAPRLPAP